MEIFTDIDPEYPHDWWYAWVDVSKDDQPIAALADLELHDLDQLIRLLLRARREIHPRWTPAYREFWAEEKTTKEEGKGSSEVLPAQDGATTERVLTAEAVDWDDDIPW